MWCEAFLAWFRGATSGTPHPPLPPQKLPVTSTILTTLPEVHSSVPPSSKQNTPQKKNRTLKPLLQSPPTQHAQPHNPPHTYHPLLHWNVKAPFKLQNLQTKQKTIPTTSHVTFTYPTNTPTTTSANSHAFIHFPTFPENNCGSTGNYSTKAWRDHYMHHCLKTLHIITHSLYITSCKYFW